MLANDVLHTIGNTPHIRVNRLFGGSHSVYIKSERSNPGGSLPELAAGSTVPGFNYDTGDRSFSVEGFVPTE